MRTRKDLCESCAKLPFECPWVRDMTEDWDWMEMMQRLSNPVPYCSEYEEERR